MSTCIRCPSTTHLGRLLACLGLLLAPAAFAQTQVYRCTAPDGSVEFRQQQCAARDTARQVEIEDQRTGWTPPSPPEETAPPPERTRSRASGTAARDAAAQRQAERCLAKRQQIERVNAQLRAGYKADQGVKLRRRRAEYEDYLRQFCR
ncbi:hypothetical protein F2Q65_12580 [Thiohalocapsa marina]|uniref:DUF4124 domain-containing protein n=1 Tax=Thiohalocapsa marina TaxID=424902 RepID=A0A5M8FKX8_9GAMM|nr:hypothetical protein [Thiohalocapsa marina]KAA6184406.1 hypothetical protein F2Q65_12580 [Thiohalocapsa marina]